MRPAGYMDEAWSTTTVWCALRLLRHTFLSAKLRSAVEMTFSPWLATPLCVPTHGLMHLLGSAGAPTRSQQSNTDQQMSFRNRWSSSTSSRIASGSWSRCHRHSSRPALSPAPSGAAARAALIA